MCVNNSKKKNRKMEYKILKNKKLFKYRLFYFLLYNKYFYL